MESVNSYIRLTNKRHIRRGGKNTIKGTPIHICDNGIFVNPFSLQIVEKELMTLCNGSDTINLKAEKSNKQRGRRIRRAKDAKRIF